MMASNQGQTRRRRSQNDFGERKISRKGKKPLPEPAHIGHFVLVVVLKICRSILFIDTSVKIGVYLIGVMIGSVICDLFIVPKSYFSEKRNIFNVYFVKFGWHWTLVLMTAYVFLTSVVYCSGKWVAVRRHLGRMAVATVQWYLCTSVFRRMELTIGICSDGEFIDSTACLSEGKDWLGFDVSGHVYILMHNMLTISEEMKTFKEWRRLGELLGDEDLPSKRKVTAEDISESKKHYKELTPYIKALFIATAVFAIMWEFMLLTSVVYRFHTLPQKIVGAFAAVFCWFSSYRMMYQLDIEWLPYQPGRTSLEFMKIQ